MYGRLPHQHFLRKTTKDEKIVQQALQQMKLVEKQESLLAELSGGERQRAWLAMALAQETEYLILDEPTTYLDLTYQIELLKLIQTLNQTQKLTIIMVLHDLNQASQYSDEIIIMHHGEISAKGTPNEVITPRMLQDVYGVSGSLFNILQEDLIFCLTRRSETNETKTTQWRDADCIAFSGWKILTILTENQHNQRILADVQKVYQKQAQQTRSVTSTKPAFVELKKSIQILKAGFQFLIQPLTIRFYNLQIMIFI